MHLCHYCHTFVLWGGARVGRARYCGVGCQAHAARLPSGLALRSGAGICAECGDVLLSGGFDVAGLRFCTSDCHVTFFSRLSAQLPGPARDGVDLATTFRTWCSKGYRALI